LALCVAVFVGTLAAIRGCHPLPSLADRSVSTAMTDTSDTRLGRGIEPIAAQHPSEAGIYGLADAREAFAVRMLLAQTADKSLDVQYYIWRGDLTGTLLLEALRGAGDRGVRVRMLLDDNGTSGLDFRLAALDAHVNIEVRLFNPFVIRSPRAIGYLTDFFRLNRRMHNKSFTADNQATVIGGRNVGDEYFDAAVEGALVFADLDVLAIGPVVRDVSTDFDRYWTSASAYPADRVLPVATPEALAGIRTAASLAERDPRAAAYMSAIRDSPVVAQLIAGALGFEWARTRMVSDDPAKGLGGAAPETLLTEQLREIIGDPMRELELVSPYFVPTAQGVKAFALMAQRGVRIRVLVNSLAATDVDAVHSGYAKRRKALLAAGITLYEMRLVPPEDEAERRAGPFGSSGASLHAKTFSVDRARVFVGSFNFDPRSANLNTELGFVIESPPIAQRIESAFDGGIPAAAYEVHLPETGELYWTEQRAGEVIRHDVEPDTHLVQRVAVWLLSLLPLEPLL
jgi:putative cardiolipin synthase